jgi:hypothetical protein
VQSDFSVCIYAKQFHVFNILTPVQYYFNPWRWINQTVEMFAAEIAADKFAADDPNRILL